MAVADRHNSQQTLERLGVLDPPHSRNTRSDPIYLGLRIEMGRKPCIVGVFQKPSQAFEQLPVTFKLQQSKAMLGIGELRKEPIRSERHRRLMQPR
jgi:hypothetical protein